MKNETTNTKIKYTIDKKSFFGHSAILLMVMSAIFRFIGCWGYWNDMLLFVMHVIVPLVSCLLLILCISFLGKKGFFLSCIPVILGVIFFIYKSFSFESHIHMVLCIVLYLAVAILYTGTVIGSIPTKWLLPPLFGLPFIYHVLVEDLPALSNTAQPVTFSAGMQEMSVLCIMAALFCVGMGLKKVVVSRETTIVAEPLVDSIEPTAAAPVGVQFAADTPVAEAEPAPMEAVPAPVEAVPAPVISELDFAPAADEAQISEIPEGQENTDEK